jgi:hypothetical protein
MKPPGASASSVSLRILGLVALRLGGPLMQAGALTHAAICIATQGELCGQQH